MSLRVLDRNALPTPKQEQWKYTNLQKALGEDLLKVRPQAPEQILVHKLAGEVSSEPDMVVWKGENGIHHQPRLKILLEDKAQATVIEHHQGAGSYWKNMGTEILLGAGAQLNYIRIQNESIDAVHTDMVHIDMNRDARLNFFSLNLGGKLMRHDVHTVINGSGAQCQLNGVNLLRGSQHCDTTILMEHVAPNSVSRQFYRSILDDSAHGVFQGKVHVHKEAKKTDGYQLANTILLSQGARMNTKPELEIYADDVKCSHGTTTGALDEEPLFYLRSRGLSEAQARLLLIQAFVDEVIDKINDETQSGQIKDLAEKWLKTQLEQK